MNKYIKNIVTFVFLIQFSMNAMLQTTFAPVAPLIQIEQESDQTQNDNRTFDDHVLNAIFARQEIGIGFEQPSRQIVAPVIHVEVSENSGNIIAHDENNETSPRQATIEPHPSKEIARALYKLHNAAKKSNDNVSNILALAAASFPFCPVQSCVKKGFEFSSPNTLAVHIREQHKCKPTLRCRHDSCERKTFGRSSDLRRHYKKVHNEVLPHLKRVKF